MLLAGFVGVMQDPEALNTDCRPIKALDVPFERQAEMVNRDGNTREGPIDFIPIVRRAETAVAGA
jgi:hypothetical protein